MPYINCAVVTLHPFGSVSVRQAVERLAAVPAIRRLTVQLPDGKPATTPPAIVQALRQAGQALATVTLGGPVAADPAHPIAAALQLSRQLEIPAQLALDEVLLPLRPADRVEQALARYRRLLRAHAQFQR